MEINSQRLAFIVSDETADEFLSMKKDTRMFLEKFRRLREFQLAQNDSNIDFLNKKIDQLERELMLENNLERE